MTHLTAQRSSERPGHRIRPRLVTTVLALAGMSATFMGTLVVPIQASLPQLLDATRSGTSWVITVTLLTASVLTPISGRLGDLFGKRRVIAGLLALLVLGSIICALSETLVPMLVGRALQGAATAVIPLGIAILRDELPPARLAVGIATVSATLGVGGALGLPVSAIVIDTLNWHAIFWFAAGLAGLDLLLVLMIVPRSMVRATGAFDVWGAIGLALGLSALMLGISMGNAWGWVSAPVLVSGVTGIVLLVLWAVFELRLGSPLVDLRLAVRPAILRTNLASVAMGFALFATSIVSSQLLVQPAGTGVGLGMGLVGASLVMMPGGLAMMAMSPVAGHLMSRIGPRTLLVLGSLLLMISHVFPLFFMTEPWQLLVAGIVAGLGVGLGYAAMPMLIMRSVPSAETAAANGLNGLARALGTAISSAVIGSLLATLTVQVGPVSAPTADGFRVAFAVAAAAGALSALLALTIPRGIPECHDAPLPTGGRVRAECCERKQS
ncbi:Multidrug resistance protein Stp [Streptomyces sp. enrichment culture]